MSHQFNTDPANTGDDFERSLLEALSNQNGQQGPAPVDDATALANLAGLTLGSQSRRDVHEHRSPSTATPMDLEPAPRSSFANAQFTFGQRRNATAVPQAQATSAPRGSFNFGQHTPTLAVPQAQAASAPRGSFTFGQQTPTSAKTQVTASGLQGPFTFGAPSSTSAEPPAQTQAAPRSTLSQKRRQALQQATSTKRQEMEVDYVEPAGATVGSTLSTSTPYSSTAVAPQHAVEDMNAPLPAIASARASNIGNPVDYDANACDDAPPHRYNPAMPADIDKRIKSALDGLDAESGRSKLAESQAEARKLRQFIFDRTLLKEGELLDSALDLVSDDDEESDDPPSVQLLRLKQHSRKQLLMLRVQSARRQELAAEIQRLKKENKQFDAEIAGLNRSAGLDADEAISKIKHYQKKYESYEKAHDLEKGKRIKVEGALQQKVTELTFAKDQVRRQQDWEKELRESRTELAQLRGENSGLTLQFDKMRRAAEDQAKKLQDVTNVASEQSLLRGGAEAQAKESQQSAEHHASMVKVLQNGAEQKGKELEQKIESQATQFNLLRDTAEGKVKELERTIESLDTQLKSLRDTAEGEVKDLNQTIRSKDELLQAYWDEGRRLSDLNAEQQAQIEKAAKTAESWQAEVAKLTASVAEYRAENQQLVAANTDLERQLGRQKDEAVEAKKAADEELSSTRRLAGESVTELEAVATKKSENLDSNVTAVDPHQKQVDRLQATVARQAVSLSGLRSAALSDRAEADWRRKLLRKAEQELHDKSKQLESSEERQSKQADRLVDLAATADQRAATIAQLQEQAAESQAQLRASLASHRSSEREIRVAIRQRNAAVWEVTRVVDALTVAESCLDRSVPDEAATDNVAGRVSEIGNLAMVRGERVADRDRTIEQLLAQQAKADAESGDHVTAEPIAQSGPVPEEAPQVVPAAGDLRGAQGKMTQDGGKVTKGEESSILREVRPQARPVDVPGSVVVQVGDIEEERRVPLAAMRWLVPMILVLIWFAVDYIDLFMARGAWMEANDLIRVHILDAGRLIEESGFLESALGPDKYIRLVYMLSEWFGPGALSYL